METVPPEILSVICGFLSPLDVANVSRVCRAFYQVAWKSEYVWHQIALRLELLTNPKKGKPWMTIVRDGRYHFIPRPEVNISPDGKTVTFPSSNSCTVLVHPPVRSGVWKAGAWYGPVSGGDRTDSGWMAGDEVAIELDMDTHRARLLQNGEQAGDFNFPEDWSECWFGMCGFEEGLVCHLRSLCEI
ncbi:hypothetical protein PAPYR_11860 [Paratrimastix pyriformis]|uniref:F-box domain-containing protein n=1 Tax=Paratrimastix pyriformis TaxID=342808 RepID=A0ABQ8U2W5_9EUKA|nr:hypothetical protein PAPYR_11860 [Paratrimastix pyriformis]